MLLAAFTNRDQSADKLKFRNTEAQVQIMWY